MTSSMSTKSNVISKTNIRQTSDGLGNGLFTISEVALGENVLLINRSFVAVLDTPSLENTCAACFTVLDNAPGDENSDSSLKSCTGCRVVRYCNKACQSRDWKMGHAQECSVFKKLYPRILPNSVRAVLRIVMRHDRGKDDAAEFDAFLKLESHARDIRNQNEEQWNRIVLSARAVKEYSGTQMEEEMIASFFAKLELNSFNLTSPFQDRVGLYLHPYAAMMNHSCDYNVIVGFDGVFMFVKPVRPLKREEQLFISYVDPTNPCDIRRKELRDRYYFDCACPKCKLGYKAPEDRYLIADPDPATVDSSKSKAMDIKAQAMGEEPSIAIMKLGQALKLLQRTGIWPITRQPMVSIRDELILAMLSGEHWHSAFAQSTLRFVKLDPVLYRYEGHPVRHLHAYSLAKLAIYLYEEQPPAKVEESISVYSFNVDLSLIIWFLLTWIVDKDRLACTASVFKETVTRILISVQGEFRTRGLEPRKLAAEANKEWVKMEKIADSVLQLERDRTEP